MLPHVVDAVGRGRVPIFVDGGIRRGTDVLKVGEDANMSPTCGFTGIMLQEVRQAVTC